MPSYFAQDYLQNITNTPNSPPHIFTNAWPSLFVGPEMSGGGLHIDAFMSNFWMVVMQGDLNPTPLTINPRP